MKMWRALLRDESGIAVEYILIIAVVAAGVIAAAYMFAKPFGEGSKGLGEKVSSEMQGSFSLPK